MRLEERVDMRLVVWCARALTGSAKAIRAGAGDCWRMVKRAFGKRVNIGGHRKSTGR